MVWHDCKTDPPKKVGFYLLVYEHDRTLDGINFDFNIIYDRALYENNKWSLWENKCWRNLEDLPNNLYPIKWTTVDWAEVDLSEVE